MPLSVDTSRLRPPVADVVLAGALAALAQYEVWSGVRYQGAPVHPGPKLAVVPALAVATAAVAWRRRYPVGVLAVAGATIAATAAAFGAGDGGASLFLVLLVIVYSAAANADRPAATAALAVGLVAVHDVFDAQIHSAGDAIFAPALGAIAFVFGRAVRARHEQALVRASAAVAGERARIARELHDAVAHSVGVMVVQAQGARALLGDGREPVCTPRSSTSSGPARMRSWRCAAFSASCARTVTSRSDARGRRSASSTSSSGRCEPPAWRSTSPSRAIPARCRWASTSRRTGSCRRRSRTSGVTPRGAHATVTVRYLADAVTVEVADDGAATTAPDPSPGSGHGHASMRERAALCGGTVRIGPRAGGGYAVEARLPLTGSAR